MDNEIAGDPAEAFYELFEDAVRLRLRSDVPVGIFLSGGLDSTSITCAVAKLRNQLHTSAAPLLAFSYQAKEFDESTYINDTVKQTGVELVPFRPEPRRLLGTLEKVLWYQDEPLHSLNALVTFELSRLASEHGVKVILNGGGPDEYLGYPVFFQNHWGTLIGQGRLVDAWREVHAHQAAHNGNPLNVFGGLLAARAKAVIRQVPPVPQLAAMKRRRRLDDQTWFTGALTSQFPADLSAGTNGDLRSALKNAVEIAPLPYYLRMEDRNSMAHSVEARMPFLDYRLVSLVFRMPAEWKMRGPWNKYVLRTAMRGRIPESARTRLDKMGFPVPTRSWFAGELYQPMQDLLASQDVRERGIYHVDVIRKDLERHKDGQVDVSTPLLQVFEFEAWLKLARSHQTATTL